MTTYIIINTIIIFGLGLICCYMFYKQQNTRQNTETTDPNDTMSKITSLDWKVKALLVLAFILVLVSFISPFLFTRSAVNEDFDFTQTGQIGDTIGGLMNPFIALAGVIVTGLAFYIQYKANLQQRELFLLEQVENKRQLQEQINSQNRQIQLQQFESQFYEMLKLHRENIGEMKINGYDFEETSTQLNRFEKTTDGRKLFVVMQTEFECILNLYTKDNKLDKVGFEKCYQLFFSGLDRYEKAYPAETNFVEMLKKARQRHENPSKNSITTNKDRKEFLQYVKLYFNYKPFSGHAQRLGHYFRHLYLSVKSVANSTIVTDYDERMRYLGILRAQLSNHEQILLFYNWLSEYGNDWENDTHSFFTEYCMIHNLWYDNLFDDKFISDNVNYLRTKKVELRKGLMFEIDG
ncbi:putative phage abortive infection protein [Flavobacterium sp.]|uniref:putative phage abortive infection protein n=1 Tax=Flavobacterium sp. TaxID=239 RepID=UPI00263005A0|nr:putative phage abortive infection protein [Flavobacterium sp.]